jgi:hypothetical protein
MSIPPRKTPTGHVIHSPVTIEEGQFVLTVQTQEHDVSLLVHDGTDILHALNAVSPCLSPGNPPEFLLAEAVCGYTEPEPEFKTAELRFLWKELWDAANRFASAHRTWWSEMKAKGDVAMGPIEKKIRDLEQEGERGPLN